MEIALALTFLCVVALAIACVGLATPDPMRRRIDELRNSAGPRSAEDERGILVDDSQSLGLEDETEGRTLDLAATMRETVRGLPLHTVALAARTDDARPVALDVPDDLRVGHTGKIRVARFPASHTLPIRVALLR